MTTYYRGVNSRSVLDNKAHSLVVDTDPMAPPPNPGPDYDPTMGLMNVDSNAKPKAPPKAETAKTQPAPVGAPKNATSPAN
ncbi:hypothetical protein QCA50_004113 [Cerrena zonata]|uniref:Uncharacterized protein n=1 Tax=Cerrena zonata TaxID=2478898 RepID=A0AAW0GG04_9APHY